MNIKSSLVISNLFPLRKLSEDKGIFFILNHIKMLFNTNMVTRVCFIKIEVKS